MLCPVRLTFKQMSYANRDVAGLDQRLTHASIMKLRCSGFLIIHDMIRALPARLKAAVARILSLMTTLNDGPPPQRDVVSLTVIRCF